MCGQDIELNYTLEVLRESVSDVNLAQTKTTDYKEVFIVCSNLSENTIYTFRIVVSNNVGFAFSDYKQFCKCIELLV